MPGSKFFYIITQIGPGAYIFQKGSAKKRSKKEINKRKKRKTGGLGQGPCPPPPIFNSLTCHILL